VSQEQQENCENEKCKNENCGCGAQDSDENVAQEETTVATTAEQKEQEDFKKKFFYLAAEVENTRKRNDRERERLLKFGNEKVLSDLIDVLDNFGRTVDAIKGDKDEKVQNILSGVDMVRKQFMAVMEKNGCKEVESLGKIFDPNFHEALSSCASEGKQENEIVTVYQNGYTLNGRLLRAAKVVVAKN